MLKCCITTLFLGVMSMLPHLLNAQSTQIINGYVEDAASGERLIAAAVIDGTSSQRHDNDTRNGTTTNSYGFFSLSVASGVRTLIVSYIGYAPQTIVVHGDTTLTVRLDVSNALQTVEINAQKQERIENTTQMSRTTIPVDQIKKMPMLLGEADVLKTLQFLPGVKGGTEGNAGIYVRGGSPDQNLILLNGVPVYNASHIAGLFSVFNADAIRNVTLTKGGFPARFGGRLSSVLEIDMKEGNKKALHVEGAIGLLTSRVLVESPLMKDKMSFIFTARRSYADLLIQPFQKDLFGASTTDFALYFYDLNAKLNYKLSDRHNFYWSFYTGYDKYGSGSFSDFSVPAQRYTIENASGLNYGNITSALRWNYLAGKKTFVNTALAYTRYQFSFDDGETRFIGDKRTFYRYDFNSQTNDLTLKSDVDYLLNAQHHLRFGLHLTNHRFTPGKVSVKESGQRDTVYGDRANNSLETMLYAEDDIQLGKWGLNIGLNLGRLDASGVDYTVLQPRLSMRYALGNNAALKASYAETAQFVHLLTNDALSIPSDSWVPSTARIRPEKARQVALGWAKTINDRWELSIEGYYKNMTDLVAYREGSSFLSQGQDFEGRIVQGKGEAYGLELFLQKKTGRMTGWIGYTLARSTRQFDDINDGQPFAFKYDRRHEFSVVFAYQLTPKISFSANWFFATGNAITLPEQVVSIITFFPAGTNAQRVISYGERNSERAVPTHRLDFGFDFVRKHARFERKWSVGVYNAYNRANPFYYELMFQNGFTQNNKVTMTYALSQISLIPVLP